MRQIRNQNLAQLLAQLRFTPQKHLRKQLDAAEKLLALIKPDREYPFDFICFHITGFHPKEAFPEQPPQKGDELADDLRIFIAKLSSQLALTVDEQGQKVYTVEALASHFDVSTKTIERWRKRGLVARKFVFNDGKKRLGFLQSAVDKFLKDNPDVVAKAKRFERLTEKEKQSVIRQARALAGRTSLSRFQIIDRIAAKLGKVHETIRYTLLNYEAANPDKPVFSIHTGVISAAEVAEIYKLFKQGTPLKELMSRFGRSKSSIYRLINQQRAKILLAKKIEFVPSSEFLDENAKQKFLAEPVAAEKPAPSKSIEPLDIADKSLLPEYLQALRNTPVLNREREVELFRRYNYLKYLASVTREGIKPTRVHSDRLEKIEKYLAEAEAVKKTIIEANLRLVVSIAGKHAAGEANFQDLVSKGNLALIKTVEEFDYTRGIRFGKTASLNIAKEYAKASGKSTELTREKAGSLANIQRYLRPAEPDFAAIERAKHNLLQVIKDELDEREQYIIINHFGLVGTLIRKNKRTLQQIGEDLGMTKERVRQLELVALQKLRNSLSIKEFELLTG
ncbi:MAG: sigma-70 family RNA polymerase sigma factor [Sedimentisphaerales bacterium]|nr:sigma-70 family RNA polymerase sigma factor [Sedimentisphaerales bacterium]